MGPKVPQNEKLTKLFINCSLGDEEELGYSQWVCSTDAGSLLSCKEPWKEWLWRHKAPIREEKNLQRLNWGWPDFLLGNCCLVLQVEHRGNLFQACIIITFIIVLINAIIILNPKQYLLSQLLWQPNKLGAINHEIWAHPDSSQSIKYLPTIFWATDMLDH